MSSPEFFSNVKKSKKKKKKTNQVNRSVGKYPRCSLQELCRGNPGSSGLAALSFLTESCERGPF
jgi:hypothetical protein